MAYRTKTPPQPPTIVFRPQGATATQDTDATADLIKRNGDPRHEQNQTKQKKMRPKNTLPRKERGVNQNQPGESRVRSAEHAATTPPHRRRRAAAATFDSASAPAPTAPPAAAFSASVFLPRPHVRPVEHDLRVERLNALRAFPVPTVLEDVFPATSEQKPPRPKPLLARPALATAPLLSWPPAPCCLSPPPSLLLLLRMPLKPLTPRLLLPARSRVVAAAATPAGVHVRDPSASGENEVFALPPNPPPPLSFRPPKLQPESPPMELPESERKSLVDGAR